MNRPKNTTLFFILFHIGFLLSVIFILLVQSKPALFEPMLMTDGLGSGIFSGICAVYGCIYINDYSNRPLGLIFSICFLSASTYQSLRQIFKIDGPTIVRNPATMYKICSTLVLTISLCPLLLNFRTYF